MILAEQHKRSDRCRLQCADSRLLIPFSPQAVPKGEHLAKYARNLTKEAMAGKLDPVIGRDDVIRRVVQVRAT
jgi:ATP-dependent Clp protease ATP-binding subunit ClpA